MRSRLWIIVALSSLLSAQITMGLDVSASLDVGGLSSITVDPGDTFTVDIYLTADQNMVSAQGMIAGEGLYFAALSRTIEINNGWDDSESAGALPFTAGALPTVDIGTLALDVYAGALAGKFASVEIGVDAATPAGEYTLELTNLRIGDLNFDAANVTSVSNLTVTVASSATPPVITAAVSRKLHGATAYDVDMLAAGAVEPRRGGPTTVVVTFDQPIQLAPGVDPAVTASNGTVGLLTVDGAALTVELSGAADREALSLAFPGVAAAASAAAVCADSVCVGVLLGDAASSGSTLPDGVVNIYDIISIKSVLDKPVTAANFLNDVSGPGNDPSDDVLNIYDIIAIKGNLDRTLLSACP